MISVSTVFLSLFGGWAHFGALAFGATSHIRGLSSTACQPLQPWLITCPTSSKMNKPPPHRRAGCGGDVEAAQELLASSRAAFSQAAPVCPGCSRTVWLSGCSCRRDLRSKTADCSGIKVCPSENQAMAVQ
eukprot:5810291-Amphidinium_carterae.1